MIRPLVFFPLLFAGLLGAQTPVEPDRLLDFKVSASGNKCSFSPIAPPLAQIPGAPAAYWTYFWEFGDGSFSREENPTHFYLHPGDYNVSLDATAHYDNGKKAKKKKKPVHAGESALTDSENSIIPDVFDPKMRQMIALFSYSKPRAEEEITLVLSYRNLGQVTTDGQLYLFYNEKKFPTTHFDFVEARTHFGEIVSTGTSQVLPLDNSTFFDWALLAPRALAENNMLFYANPTPSTIIQEMLNNARGTYKGERGWQFSSLAAGEKRNMFISLACTPNMLRDTNATIHLEAVFAPSDPAVAPERFVYEIEIVGSHDPNGIAVSDNVVNYRIVGSKKLNYKIQFQNNGEGPASKVEVKVDIPKGLKIKGMNPVEWHPKCPICPKTPTKMGCLDTATVDGALVFTFKNIYLPGSRQKDVDNRDSTKGFVKFSIGSGREMPKLPFRTRAKIVFDKNPPIYTNYTRTRFKVGISPGLKAGYGFHPDSLSNGYAFLGISVSPYKSWRFYPQAELLTGFQGRKNLPEESISNLFAVVPNNGIAQFDSLFMDTLRTVNRGFVSVEVPFLIRKNFTRFFGLGLGASVRATFESGEVKMQTGRTTIDWEFTDGPTGFVLKRNFDKTLSEATIEPYKKTFYRYAVFADLTLGSVRAGPNVGARAGYLLGGKNKHPFVQISLEVKL